MPVRGAARESETHSLDGQFGTALGYGRMEIKAVVGRNVKRYPELKVVSQEKLAFQPDLHRTYVSSVERGIRNPTIAIVARLAVALGEKPATLLKYQEDQ